MDLDSQESPEREKDWAESPFAKTLWRSSFSRGQEIGRFPNLPSQIPMQRVGKTPWEDHQMFLPQPQNALGIAVDQLQCTHSSPLLRSTPTLYLVPVLSKSKRFAFSIRAARTQNKNHKRSRGHAHIHLARPTENIWSFLFTVLTSDSFLGQFSSRLLKKKNQLLRQMNHIKHTLTVPRVCTSL